MAFSACQFQSGPVFGILLSREAPVPNLVTDPSFWRLAVGLVYHRSIVTEPMRPLGRWLFPVDTASKYRTKMVHPKTLLIGATSALTWLATTAWAGSVIQMESRDFTQSPPEAGRVVISVEGQSLRMDTNGVGADDRGSMVFDGSVNEMTAIDHPSKQYFVIDEAALQGMANQMGAAMRQMEAALADLPPEQRAMAEQMMKQRMGAMGGGAAVERPAPEVTPTGESDTVNGYDCDVYEVSEAGQRTNELCVAAWADIEGGREFADGMKRMAGFFEQMQETFREAGANVMDGSDNVLAHLEEMDGFPVRSRTYDGGDLVDETTIVSSESKSLESAMFAPPPDYRQQTMRP